MRSHLLAAAVVVALLACSRAAQVNLPGQPTAAAAAPIAPAGFGGAFKARPLGTGAVKVGPTRGTVVVVGGGSMGPEIYKAFIDAAGGPDALILDVPNASGNPPGPNAGKASRNAGTQSLVVLYTTDRNVAESASFRLY